MAKITLEVDAVKKDLRDSVAQALSDLDLIIDNSSTLTTAQMRAALKTLAQVEKRMIKFLQKQVEGR